MQITRPLPGQTFDLSAHITFEGTTDTGTASVQLLADGKFPLPDATVSGTDWSLSHQFTGPGVRNIAATAAAAGGRTLAVTSVDIRLTVSALAGYQPPAASLARLGQIAHALEGATRVDHQFQKGGKIVLTLPGGILYYDSLLDLDSDGSRFFSEDGTGQNDTSLHMPDGKPVDSDAVPFFVLPGGFYKPLGIRLGDVAAVLFGDKIEYAIFADVGPSTKLGEGSIALHRALGHETIRNGRFHDEAIDANVLTLVFPGSGDGTPQTPDLIRAIGKARFTALGGNA